MRKQNVLSYFLNTLTLAFALYTSPCLAGEDSTALEENAYMRQKLIDQVSEEYLGVEWIPNGFSIAIGKAQRICYFRDSIPLHCAGISSGKKGYKSITGNFQIQSKERMHYSSKYPDATGMPAKMPWSMHFYGNYFIHEGRLPGYPASHGCIRVAKGDAKKFFDLARVGDPVVVTN